MAGDFELDPAGGFEAGVGVVAEEGFLGGVGVLNDVPAVAGEVGAVDDEGADGSHAGGLLELVGPAAVVGEGFAAEEFGVVGGWVADDAENDFALDVDAGVVVPVELGGGDAVADEDDGGVEGGGRGEGLVGNGVVGGVGEFLRGAVGGEEGEAGLPGDGLHADEVDLLQVAAPIAGGLQAGEGELVGDVVGGELAAAQAGVAAFKEVGGDEAIGFTDAVGAHGGFGPGEGGRRGLLRVQREEAKGGEAGDKLLEQKGSPLWAEVCRSV